MRFRKAAVLAIIGGVLTAAVAKAQGVSVTTNVSVTVQTIEAKKPGAPPNSRPIEGKVDYATGKLYVTGMGVPADEATTNAQRIATARTAARDDALRNVAAIISGIHVSNVTRTVMNKLTKDDIETSTKAFIKMGRTYDNPKRLPPGLDFTEDDLGLQEVDEGGGKKSYLYLLAMEVPLYGPGGAAQTVFQNQNQPQTPAGLAAADPNSPSQYANVPAVGTGPETRDVIPPGATGLIVDCTGLPVKPAMSPAIYNQETKTAIYPVTDISTKIAVEQGIVGYLTSMDEAKKSARVGANPVIARAVAMPNNGPEGDRASFDVIVSAETARAIQQANQTGRFLESCRVIFVLKP